ncbi:MAG: hypothetical protein DSZ28_01290 [Thiothrix sp.]|nr:MAG: hypothetical protein DSZ28_01290 [Thiothrix sp.]
MLTAPCVRIEDQEIALMLVTPDKIRILQTTAWMQEVEQRRSSCRESYILSNTCGVTSVNDHY